MRREYPTNVARRRAAFSVTPTRHTRAMKTCRHLALPVCRAGRLRACATCQVVALPGGGILSVVEHLLGGLDPLGEVAVLAEGGPSRALAFPLRDAGAELPQGIRLEAEPGVWIARGAATMLLTTDDAGAALGAADHARPALR
jgi:hypothetical protein